MHAQDPMPIPNSQFSPLSLPIMLDETVVSGLGIFLVKQTSLSSGVGVGGEKAGAHVRHTGACGAGRQEKGEGQAPKIA